MSLATEMTHTVTPTENTPLYEQYANALYDDLEMLGQLADGTRTWRSPQDSAMYFEFVRLLYATQKLNRYKLPEVDHANLATEIGQRALLAMHAGATFGENPAEHVGCVDTEGNLLFSLSPEDVANTKRRPSHVLTVGKQVVGIMKGVGEPSVYGIADAPKHGIYEGVITFMSSTLSTRLRGLPYVDRAYIHDIGGETDSWPRRFAAFMIPIDVRQSVRPEYNGYGADVLATSHEEIVTRVHELADTAIQAPIK